MGDIIAGIYEIESKLGEGGGGIVYLGKHTRLNKKVVLKADKRTLRTKKDVLRREVDMLKGLNHTYIPQVYDFVEQNGTVYTVMDYIEGESLDKVLDREGKREQKEVIKWALEILEALSYLHRQGEYGILHGDIKPANIMLRPSGDICLIDFNIALALGEEGAVKVGFSRGYASPEHYGAEYAEVQRRTIVNVNDTDQTVACPDDKTEVYLDDKTEVNLGDKTEVDDDRTVADKKVPESKSTVTPEGEKVLLDVRSDIYSVGATLYHLFSGIKPKSAAEKVSPLSKEQVSPLISKIIEKAMMLDPNERFQSADEMLEAFLGLRKNDSRVKSRKRLAVISTTLISTLFLLSGFVTFVGLKQKENRKEAVALAAYSEDALRKGDINKAVSLALDSMPSGNSIFEAKPSAEGEKALVAATGLYNLSDGFQDFKNVELPAAPFKLSQSQDGSVYAALYGYEVRIFIENDDVISLPIQHSAYSDCIFADNETIIYSGEDGVSLYNLKERKVVWKGEKCSKIALSGDKKKAAVLSIDGKNAFIYELDSGKQIKKLDFEGRYLPKAENDIFADPQDYVFTLNSDGNVLAVSLSTGSISIFFLENDTELETEPAKQASYSGGFYGSLFAYAKNNDKGKSELHVFDLEDIRNPQEILENPLESKNEYKIMTDEDGIYISNEGKLTKVKPGEEEREMAFTNELFIKDYVVFENYTVVITEDDKLLFFNKNAELIQTYEPAERIDFMLFSGNIVILANRDNPEIRLLKLENHDGTKLASYPVDVAHDEARISIKEDRIILFDYKKFHIFDLKGRLIKEEELQNPEKIYDQQFIRDEKESYLEVIWYDGMLRRYGLTSGNIIKEEKGEQPNKELREEFITGKYRIVSILHESPKVYQKGSDKLVKELKGEDYLTYVTETDQGLITEYVNADGKRYGLLLNERFEVKAELPSLCDVFDNKAVFDYKSGELRSTDIYSLEEIISKAASLKMGK